MIRVTKNLRLFAEIQGYRKPVLLRYESDGWYDGHGFMICISTTPMMWYRFKKDTYSYTAILGLLIQYRRR